MIKRWTPADYVNADAVEHRLASIEQSIKAATPTDQPVTPALRDYSPRWLHAPAEDRQRLLDEAKAAALKRQVELIRQTRDTSTCSACKRGFVFYGQPHPECPPTPTTPSLCLKCYREEKDRREREERLDEFSETNPLSHHYLHEHKGAPPRPAQYETVMNWKGWSEDGDRISLGLVLVGDSFTGKTTACYHLAHKLVESGEYYSFLAVNSGHLNTIPEKVLDRSIGEFMERLQTTELLLIDDLDKVRITPRVASELWTLFEVRLREHRLPIFITLNTRTKRDFVRLFSGRDADSAKVGESIYNRLRQACQFIDFDMVAT